MLLLFTCNLTTDMPHGRITDVFMEGKMSKMVGLNKEDV